MKRLLQQLLGYILVMLWIVLGATVFIISYLSGDPMLAIGMLIVFGVTGYFLCNYTEKIGL